MSTRRPLANKRLRDEEEDEEEEDDEEDDVRQRGDDDEVLLCKIAGCGKEFGSRWSLTRHIRTHTGERPFKCNECGKEFVQRCSLKRHEQTHSNAKQWICPHPDCGKQFKLKEYLDVHRRTHMKLDGSKSYDVGFSSSSSSSSSGGLGIVGLGAAAVLSSSSSGSLLGLSGVIGATAGGMGAYSSAAPVSGSSSNNTSNTNNGNSSSSLFAVGLDAVSSAIDSTDLAMSAGGGEPVGAYGAEGDSTEGMLIDQMRQRLVRMSVRHHKQEKELKSKLEECAGALLECITLLNVIAPEAVPTHIQQTASRVAAIVEKEQKPRALKIGRI